jgi:hypothetical protein
MDLINLFLSLLWQFDSPVLADFQSILRHLSRFVHSQKRILKLNEVADS